MIKATLMKAMCAAFFLGSAAVHVHGQQNGLHIKDNLGGIQFGAAADVGLARTPVGRLAVDGAGLDATDIQADSITTGSLRLLSATGGGLCPLVPKSPPRIVLLSERSQGGYNAAHELFNNAMRRTSASLGDSGYFSLTLSSLNGFGSQSINLIKAGVIRVTLHARGLVTMSSGLLDGIFVRHSSIASTSGTYTRGDDCFLHATPQAAGPRSKAIDQCMFTVDAGEVLILARTTTNIEYLKTTVTVEYLGLADDILELI